MTNKMVENANRFLYNEIIQKNRKELMESLNSFASKGNDDYDNEITCMKEFPNTYDGFRKMIDRITGNRKPQKNAWSLKITENSLLLIYALYILGISPEKMIETVDKTNIFGDSKFNEINDAMGMLLDDIKEIKELLKNTRMETHTLTNRFTFFYNMLLFFFNAYNNYVNMNNLPPSGFNTYPVNFYNNNLPPSQFILCMNQSIIHYTQEIMRYTYNMIPNKALKKNIAFLWKNEVPCCVNIHFLYRLIIFTIDFMEKYNKAVTRKDMRIMSRMFNNIPVSDGKENKFLFLSYIKDMKEKVEVLIEQVARLNENYLRNYDLTNLTSELLFMELQILWNIFTKISILDPNTGKLATPNPFDAKTLDAHFSNMLCQILETKFEERNFTGIENFGTVYKQLHDKLNDIIGAPYFNDLYDIQKKALNFIDALWKKNLTPIIATGMGSGKTRVACKKIHDILDKENGYVLIVTLRKVIPEWENELRKCNMPLPVIVQGNDRFAILEKGFNRKGIYITTYESIAIDFEKYENNKPVFTVYDELHVVNNSEKIQDKFFSLAKFNQKVSYKLALTGTPVQNSVNEFYMNFCFFGNDEYLDLIKRNQGKKDFLGSEEKLNSLKEKIVCHQIYFFQTEETPKVTVKYNLVPLAIYNEHLHGLESLSKELKDKDKSYTENEKRRYLISPANFKIDSHTEINTTKNSSKIEFAKAIIKGIDNMEKIIVFSFHKAPLLCLYNSFPDDAVLEIGSNSDIDNYGSENMNYCRDIEEFYNSRGNGEKSGRRILLTTMKMSGTGRNLDVANNMILLEAWWNPMLVQQTLHREIRSTQKKTVNIYVPLYFEKSKNGGYRLHEYEKNLWKTMTKKIELQNKFLDELVKIAKEKNPPEAERLELGKKYLPMKNILNTILLFDDEKFCENLNYDNSIVNLISIKNNEANYKKIEDVLETDSIEFENFNSDKSGIDDASWMEDEDF